MKLCRFLICGTILLLLHGCNSNDESNFQLKSYTYDFGISSDQWQPGFSDFPAGANDSAFYELKYEYTDSPVGNKKAIMLSGNNHSDDLFMFLKRKLGNLQPNTQYTITFEVEFASNAKVGEIGAGGAPGESVYMKVGAASVEPRAVVESGNYVLNLDKGNQAVGGVNMIIIGDISIPANATGYELTSRSNSAGGSNLYKNPVVATTNSNGELWLVVGTDSGYEGITTIYYTRITAVVSRSM
jgi:hypothetical protein